MGYDPFTSILKNHWDFFVSELPGAESVFITREFLALKLSKGHEEIEALRKSALVQYIGRPVTGSPTPSRWAGPARIR